MSEGELAAVIFLGLVLAVLVAFAWAAGCARAERREVERRRAFLARVEGSLDAGIDRLAELDRRNAGQGAP